MALSRAAAALAAASDSRSRSIYAKDSSFSFCMTEDDIADPNSFFDVDIAPLSLNRDRLSSSSSGHRQSKSSSDSKEFDFSACMTPPDLEDPKNIISPADDLFFNGKLLPLYMSQRLQQLSNKTLSAEQQHSSIAFSCYLHSAAVDIDMKMEPVAGDESSSSRESSRKASSGGSSSRDSSEESSYNYSRAKHFTHNLNLRQQALKNEADAAAAGAASGRFRWKLFLGGQRRSSRVVSEGSLNCEANVCKSCGQHQHQRNPKFQTDAFSISERRSYESQIFPSWTSHSGGLPPCDKFHRHSTGSSAGFAESAHRRQSLSRAKEFWRKYLRPFISRTSSSSTSSSQQQSLYSSRPSEDHHRFFFSGNFKRPASSRSITPIASPTHSGSLLPTSSPVAPDDVQGAIAYCKQTRGV